MKGVGEGEGVVGGVVRGDGGDGATTTRGSAGGGGGARGAKRTSSESRKQEAHSCTKARTWGCPDQSPSLKAPRVWRASVTCCATAASSWDSDAAAAQPEARS